MGSKPPLPLRLLSALVLLGVLASCTSSSGEEVQEGTLKALEGKSLPLGTVLDERVTGLLPAGSYNVEMKDSVSPKTVARGYVHLPATGDPLEECAYDVDIEQTRVKPGTGTEEYTVSYRTVKPVGSDSFTKVRGIEEIAVEDDSYKEYYEVGVWGSGDDPNTRTWPSLLFPSFLLVERGGSGYLWCGIGVIDEVARLADPATGLIAWDQTQFAYSQAALRDSWHKQIAELSGLGDEWLKPLEGMPVPSYETLLNNSPTRITRDSAGVVTVTLDFRSRTLTLVLSPTIERSVARPAGAKTFLERIAEMKGDPEAVLNMLDPEGDDSAS